jgi:methionyl-tRNA formyltransferase
MKVNQIGYSTSQVAIIARYPFYFDDIRRELHDLDAQVISATEISEIQKHIDDGVNFDYIFFPHYSKLIPSEFLERHNCIGFHTGDLPKDRGGSPIQNKILRGEYFTWVSALKLIDKLDAGDILCREEFSLEHGSIEIILKDISKVIARLIRTVLTKNPAPIAQTGDSSIYPRLNHQDSELRIEDLEVRQIYDRIRMLDGLDYPPAYLQFGRYRILLNNAELRDNALTFVSRLEEKS